MSRPGAGRSGACKGRKCPEGPPEQLGGHSSYPSRGTAGHMERGAIPERPSAGPLGHPCGDGEQVGRPTRQEGEGQRGWRQRFHGRGNGSEERGARAQRPLPPPNLCRCRPAPTPQTLRPVGAMTGGPGDREQRPEPTCGLHGGSLCQKTQLPHKTSCTVTSEDLPEGPEEKRETPLLSFSNKLQENPNPHLRPCTPRAPKEREGRG